MVYSISVIQLLSSLSTDNSMLREYNVNSLENIFVSSDDFDGVEVSVEQL